jgi:enoyl-[acyl-carrier protein] reductase/trans-2-enoyl-CoA reductase (NAD+)
MYPVNKALVTQASSAIPVIPLYICFIVQNNEEEGIMKDVSSKFKRLYSEDCWKREWL